MAAFLRCTIDATAMAPEALAPGDLGRLERSPVPLASFMHRNCDDVASAQNRCHPARNPPGGDAGECTVVTEQSHGGYVPGRDLVS